MVQLKRANECPAHRNSIYAPRVVTVLPHLGFIGIRRLSEWLRELSASQCEVITLAAGRRGIRLLAVHCLYDSPGTTLRPANVPSVRIELSDSSAPRTTPPFRLSASPGMDPRRLNCWPPDKPQWGHWRHAPHEPLPDTATPRSTPTVLTASTTRTHSGHVRSHVYMSIGHICSIGI